MSLLIEQAPRINLLETLPDEGAPRIKEILKEVAELLVQEVIEDPILAVPNDVADVGSAGVVRKRTRAWGELSASELTTMTAQVAEELCAIINIQTLRAPGVLNNVSGTRSQSKIGTGKINNGRKEVSDPDYQHNYELWAAFLVVYCGCMERVCDIFHRKFLKSVLITEARSVLAYLEHTMLPLAPQRIFTRMCVAAGVAESQATQLVEAARIQEDGAQSTLPSETGLGFLLRDCGGAKEEDLGIISFECITNDRKPATMIKLIYLKNIISRQLPKMPREYIVRLVLDRNHYSFCLLKKGQVIGGVCFRPFFTQKFAEIAFLAVTATEQVKGYGTRLMSHLKEHVKKAGIEYFLTYADNFATGYFQKQGFSAKLKFPKEKWYGYIKDYDGGTLMECHISKNIDYLKVAELLIEQKRALRSAMKRKKPLRVYAGLDWWKVDPTRRPKPLEIPGFGEAGWQYSDAMSTQRKAKHLHEELVIIVDQLIKRENAWPFREPVKPQEAPGYYDVIKHPMDLSKIWKKAKQKAYATVDDLWSDIKLMFDNARLFNEEVTIYYKFANELEAFVKPKLDALRNKYR